LVEGLNDNSVYYWTVVPTAKGVRGTCLSSVQKFGIDLYNTKSITTLILPKDKIIVPRPPILYWDYIDPDPLEKLRFDIYWSDDKSLVESFDPNVRKATIKATTSYYFPSIFSTSKNKTYYWTVISFDRDGPGICNCGVWSFTINNSQNNYPPITQLSEPIEKKQIIRDYVQLKWNGTDDDGDSITYNIYLSEDMGSIIKFDKSSKIMTTEKTQITINNLSYGKKYYWTVIPDDGKVSGNCIDQVWSFETKDKTAKNDENDSDETFPFQFFQIIIILFILIILILSVNWLIRKKKRAKMLKKYIKSGKKGSLPEEVKGSILSSTTLRAFHTTEDVPEDDDSVVGVKEIEISEKQTHKTGSKKGSTTSKISTDLKTKIKSKTDPSPYQHGKYDHTVAKLKYKPVNQEAKHVKHAIPYAAGNKAEKDFTSKAQMKLAEPLQKKIITDKPLKASSMPITRQCPKCGSFKVKTYKDETNKCLECKIRF